MSTTKKPDRSISEAEFKAFFEEFKSESDRAAVILGAAKLDLLLYQIIQQFLAPATGGKDELLDGDAPLGTFSAKIMLTNRLGLIDNEFTRALQFVRRIRNSFAHEVTGCTLDSGSHRDRVKEMVAQLKHKNFFIAIRANFFDGDDTPSANFRTAMAFLVVRLEHLLNHTETVGTSAAVSIFSKAMLDKGEVENHWKGRSSGVPVAHTKHIAAKKSLRPSMPQTE